MTPVMPTCIATWATGRSSPPPSFLPPSPAVVVPVVTVALPLHECANSTIEDWPADTHFHPRRPLYKGRWVVVQQGPTSEHRVCGTGESFLDAFATCAPSHREPDGCPCPPTCRQWKRNARQSRNGNANEGNGQRPSASGKRYSAMTGQALYYLGETDLKHKILAIVEEEGAERASYALKLLQSEGALTIASTGKDGNTGRMVTQEYRVEGPVMIFLTTTAIKIDEELLNRCIILSVDENREQTRAIHQFQRRRQTLAGLLADHDRQKTLTLHRNAQRLLRPLLVANPYAEALTFQDDKTRTRRDHVKYLTLIRAITLLHQYQRPLKTTVHNDQAVEYIEVTVDDIAVANRLACEALGRSVDELPPQTQKLLGLVDEMVTTACEQLGIDRMDYRFTRREVREFTRWGHTQLKLHLKRLEEMEYLLVHRGGRGQSFVYELLYDCPADAQSKFLAKLIDVDDLKCDSQLVGATRAGGRAKVGAKSASSRAEVGVGKSAQVLT